MHIKSMDGDEIGEVHMDWHLFRRKYDLFRKGVQFGRADAPLLSWTFPLNDQNDENFALVDKNFTGFAREIFTDAGQYAVHFTGEDTKPTKVQIQLICFGVPGS
eukprot:m.396911 g.396911  ORF g.396911 m.396911 type:complete len:104 (-) comp56416_c0_seq15:170-481(-)